VVKNQYRVIDHGEYFSLQKVNIDPYGQPVIVISSTEEELCASSIKELNFILNRMRKALFLPILNIDDVTADSSRN